jgi:molecular chaperone GrpE
VNEQPIGPDEVAEEEGADPSSEAPAETLDALEVEEDLDELSRLTKERDELRDMAQRLQADFENYRKRSAAQAEVAAQRLAAQVVADLLPVLDALDLAEAHLDLSGELSVEAEALVAARKLLLDALSKSGLEAVPGAEAPFDPQVHDAVAHAEGEGDQVVDEVLRAGYVFRGTVLRPAMVRVRG